jgi:hypothetical protein
VAVPFRYVCAGASKQQGTGYGGIVAVGSAQRRPEVVLSGPSDVSDDDADANIGAIRHRFSPLRPAFWFARRWNAGVSTRLSGRRIFCCVRVLQGRLGNDRSTVAVSCSGDGVQSRNYGPWCGFTGRIIVPSFKTEFALGARLLRLTKDLLSSSPSCFGPSCFPRIESTPYPHRRQGP